MSFNLYALRAQKAELKRELAILVDDLHRHVEKGGFKSFDELRDSELWKNLKTKLDQLDLVRKKIIQG